MTKPDPITQIEEILTDAILFEPHKMSWEQAKAEASHKLTRVVEEARVGGAVDFADLIWKWCEEQNVKLPWSVEEVLKIYKAQLSHQYSNKKGTK